MNPGSVKEIVGILMESTLYFDLSVKERKSLIQHILELSICPEQRPGENPHIGEAG